MIKFLFVAYKALLLLLFSFFLQWLITLLIYSIGVLVSENGLISSYIAAPPLALALSLTVPGLLVLLYLFVVSPVVHLTLSIKRAKLSWLERISNLKSIDDDDKKSLDLCDLERIKLASRKLSRKSLGLSLVNGALVSCGLLVFVLG